MSYPTFEQYNEAVQNPKYCFADKDLQNGRVKTSGLGTPVALCGGFALTYKVSANGRNWAVRCFHKKSVQLERRYQAISKKIAELSSPYFLDFDFQPSGVKVNGSAYGLLKMAWAEGETLGEFLDSNYNNPSKLQNLLNSIVSLSTFLENASISHGDIQPGNLMISDNGRVLKLIDYDGMYVDEIQNLGSSEMGHRNFQHPMREKTNPFNKKIDRFSIILLYLALQALIENNHVWRTTQSDVDGIVFRAGDFLNPENSPTFKGLIQSSKLKQHVFDFAAICKSSMDVTPSLNDFIAHRNIPQVSLNVGSSTEAIATVARYISNYAVLHANQFSECESFVGDRVELIGRVNSVKYSKTSYGDPYYFINFSDWREKSAKIIVWSYAIPLLDTEPNSSWAGQWISVVGLLEPIPKPSAKIPNPQPHISISISHRNQIKFLSNDVANFRLQKQPLVTRSIVTSSNQEILNKLKERSTGKPQSASVAAKTPASTTLSTNQQILQAIAQNKASRPSSAPAQNIPPSRPMTSVSNQPTAASASKPQSPNYQSANASMPQSPNYQGSNIPKSQTSTTNLPSIPMNVSGPTDFSVLKFIFNSSATAVRKVADFIIWIAK